MTKSGKEQDKETADHPALDPARMPDFSEALSLNPMMTHPGAALMAATAIGFSFATQMAGVFFGALHKAMESTNGGKPADESAVAPVAAPVEAEKPVSPVAKKSRAKPVRKTPVPVAAPEMVAAPEALSSKAASKVKVPAKAQAKPAARLKAPNKVEKSAGDLKKISGIGPKLEGVLNGMGVNSLAQVASWKDADIARFDKELGFEGRIGRDDWVGQAKALLK